MMVRLPPFFFYYSYWERILFKADSILCIGQDLNVTSVKNGQKWSTRTMYCLYQFLSRPLGVTTFISACTLASFDQPQQTQIKKNNTTQQCNDHHTYHITLDSWQLAFPPPSSCNFMFIPLIINHCYFLSGWRRRVMSKHEKNTAERISSIPAAKNRNDHSTTNHHTSHSHHSWQCSWHI